MPRRPVTLYLTTKQYKIMRALMKLAPDGDFLDLDQLLEAVDYQTSKQSMQFSLRALIKHDLIENKAPEIRRGRRRRVIALTDLGYKIMGRARMSSVQV